VHEVCLAIVNNKDLLSLHESCEEMEAHMNHKQFLVKHSHMFELISTTLPRSRICIHVLALELPQVSM